MAAVGPSFGVSQFGSVASRISAGCPVALDLDLVAFSPSVLGGLLRMDRGRETCQSSMRMELELGIQIGRNP